MASFTAEPQAPYTPHSCTHCRKFVISPPGHRQPRAQDAFVYRLPYSVSEARTAAKEGCSLYRIFIGLIIGPVKRSEIVRNISNHINNDTEEDYGERLHGANLVVQFAERLTKHPFRIIIQGEGRNGARTATLAVYESIGGTIHLEANAYAEDDPASSICNIRPINRNITSELSYATARSWLSQCGMNDEPGMHPLCPLAENINFTPTRLIEAQRRADVYSVKLRITQPGEIIPYSCLSYCWGGDQPVKTTKATLDVHQEGIRFSDLPRTLQDAIAYSIELGISHIWIDCLCIVQDDQNDLGIELPKLPAVYKNAYVTVSASSASSCYEGFLGPRRPQTKLPHQCEDLTLQYKCSNGQVGNLYLFLWVETGTTPGTFPINGDHRDPVRKRAWTYQERILSPRVLDFGKEQLRWKCNSRALPDGGFSPLELTDGAWEGRARGCPNETHQLGNPNQLDAVGRAIFHAWANHVGGYTRCLLSFPGDKLIAIAAIAMEIGIPLNMTYLAGLWKEQLAAQLLWGSHSPLLKRPEIYRAPSWSWASVDSIVFPPTTCWDIFRTTQIQVLEASVDPVVEGFPYGAVRTASLVLKGYCMKALWYVNGKHSLEIDGWVFKPSPDLALSEPEKEDQPSGHLDALEEGYDTEDLNFAVEVQCLGIMAGKGEPGIREWEGLILVPTRPEQSGCYRRIGNFYANPQGKYRNPFEHAEQSVLTIY